MRALPASSFRPLKTSVSVTIDSEEWCSPAADLLGFDERVHEAEDRALPSQSFLFSVTGPRASLRTAAKQVFTRYQRLFQQRNRHSRSTWFGLLLDQHRALHTLDKPLVRADFDHALDVWQWLLRLAPDASLALQIAGLFHDVERLRSEADARIEHTARDYQTFKNDHARGGAELLREKLAPLDVPAEVTERAVELVARHEQPSDDPELQLLNDADALSFFALNSSGFLRHFGPEHTLKKIDYTLSRMTPSAQALLPELRFEPALQNMLNERMAPSGQVARAS
jgi:hypothetical protein